MILKLLVLVCLFFIHCKPSSEAGSIHFIKAHYDSIEKWTEVGVKGAQTRNLETAIAVIDALGKAISYAGPFAAVITGILSIFVDHDSELKQVMDKLDQMNTRLDQLDDHIKEAISKIETVAIQEDYKKQTRAITMLKTEYKRFISNPTAITRADFRNKCSQLKGLEFVKWIESEMTTERTLPLRQEMIKDFDLKEYEKWCARVSAVLSDAIFLHITCIGASNYTEADISKTLNGQNGKPGDIDLLKASLTQIKSSFSEGSHYIKSSFYSHAKEEVETYLQNYESSSHSDFSQHLYDQLKAKYYWRSWVVAAWDGDTLGDNEHQIVTSNAKSSWNWLRIHKRCLLVSSVLEGTSSSALATQIDYHCENLKEDKPNNVARETLHYLINVCRVSDFSILAVVRYEDHHFSYAASSTSVFVSNGNYGSKHWGQYRVWVIAVPSST